MKNAASTQPQPWPLRKLRAAKAPDPDDRLKIVIPRFQRGLVWSADRKEELIESLYRGYPIGALLVSDTGKLDDSGNRIYALIDGLQRTQAILEHLDQPLARAPWEILPEAQVAALAQAIGAVTGQPTTDMTRVGEEVVEWARRCRKPTAEAGFDAEGLWEHLRHRLHLPVEPDGATYRELKPLLAKVVDGLRDEADVSGALIPVLVYSGPEQNLPEIFERLNKTGANLTKYQIFAAAWVEDDTEVDNPKIRKAIARKYLELERAGYDVDRDLGPDGDTASLFEYLFGLSRVLSEEFPRLFRGQGADDSSIAFALATLVRGRPLDSMATLPKFVTASGESPLKVGELERAILEAATLVDDALAPFVGLRLTAESSAIAHGDLQMVSLIAAAVAHRYDSSGSWGSRPGWSTSEKRLRRAIPQHYLIDIIGRRWRGPLYTLAYDRVWTKQGAPSDHYLNPPSRDAWDDTLDSWYREQMAEANDRRPNVSAVEKVFLKFIYSDVVTVHDQNKFLFDVEHLFPVGRLLKLTAGGPGWPIGCIANLALLEKGVNRRKRDETIAEYFARPVAARGPSDDEKSKLARYLLCDPLAVAIGKNGTEDFLTKSEFEAFLDARWATLRKDLYAKLGVT